MDTVITIADDRESLKEKLPVRLVDELCKIAQKYQKKGLELFVFGSFAHSNARATSDLDLGVQWKNERDPRLFTELYTDIQHLPTIREIDLIDTEQVSDRFRKKLFEKGVLFLNKQDKTNV